MGTFRLAWPWTEAFLLAFVVFQYLLIVQKTQVIFTWCLDGDPWLSLVRRACTRLVCEKEAEDGYSGSRGGGLGSPLSTPLSPFLSATLERDCLGTPEWEGRAGSQRGERPFLLNLTPLGRGRVALWGRSPGLFTYIFFKFIFN